MRAVGSWPMFAEHGLASRSKNGPKDKRNRDGVIELPGHRDEVRNEIEGERQVAHEEHEQGLTTAGDARIGEETTNED